MFSYLIQRNSGVFIIQLFKHLNFSLMQLNFSFVLINEDITQCVTRSITHIRPHTFDMSELVQGTVESLIP